MGGAGGRRGKDEGGLGEDPAGRRFTLLSVNIREVTNYTNNVQRLDKFLSLHAPL